MILLFTTISLSPIFLTQAAGEGQWITGYQIQDAQTNLLLREFNSTTGANVSYSPIIPGAEIKVTFTINVFTSGSGNLKLSTGLAKSLSGKYWELVTQDYNLGSAYNPNSATAEFNWVVGTFTMILYGKVPVSTTPTDAAKTINVLSLYGPTGGEAIDKISVIATTANMNTYQTLLTQKQTKLQELIASGVAPGYIQIYTNVINASKTEAAAGYVDNAIALLNALDTTSEPVSSVMETLFLPIVGVTAAVAVIFVIMFFRARGKVSYFHLVVEDQIKDLEGLTLRAAKIDRTMASSLESIKDSLKRLVGM